MIFIIMDRDNKIIEMYNSGITAKIISENLVIGKKTVYRVLEKNNVPLHKTIEKKCLVCNKECVKNICGTCNTNLRRFRVKQKSVEYLGNKCNRCGWSGHLSGFDFHHTDPTEKDFSPNALNLANKSWEIAKKELDKCELLCALCHRKEHSDYEKLYELVKTYKGKEFKVM
jgi:hypothetical protein